MKFTFSIVLFVCLVAVVRCQDDDEYGGTRSEGVLEKSIFGAFSSLAEGFGLKDAVRQAQIQVLGAAETMLDHTTDLYDNFQIKRSEIHKSGDQRGADLKKALRYLKTEARRLREDIEDEIEIEKEKAAEAEQEEEKRESNKKIGRLQGALKKLDEVANSKIPRRRSSFRKRQSEHAKQQVDPMIQSKKTKTETEASKNVEDETTTMIPLTAMSLGDGFGRHM